LAAVANFLFSEFFLAIAVRGAPIGANDDDAVAAPH
jgi:hypothetical protein